MLTVKQVLENYNIVSDKSNDSDIKLSVLAEAGIIEEAWLPMIKRSLNKSVNEMTEAERKTLKHLLEMLIDYTLLDESRKMDYPSDKEMPVVIILKRKAIRVYPDNQKVGLYYSQALDRYISIPFGKNSKDLSPVLNENRPLVRTSTPKRTPTSPESPVISRIQNQRNTRQLPTLRKRNPNASRNVIGAVAAREPKLATVVKKKEDAGEYDRVRNIMIRRLGANGLSDAGISGRDAAKAYISKGDITSGLAVGATVGALNIARSVGQKFKDKFRKLKEEQNIDEIFQGAAVPAIAGVAGRLFGRKALDTVRKQRNKPKADKPEADKPKTDKPKGKPKNPYRSTRKLPSLNKKNKASDAGGGDDKPLFNKLDGEYGFTQGGRPQFAVDNPTSVTGRTSGNDPSNVANLSRQYNRQQQQQLPGSYSTPNAGRQIPISESTIEKLRNMVNQNIPSTAIQLGEETITINKSIAKKIIKLHESLTPNNKNKLETMLQEDVVSFRKALNFALKQ